MSSTKQSQSSSRKGGRPTTWIGGGGLCPKKLSSLGVPQLRALFVEVFGEQTASNNAAWLRRKLAQPPDDDMGRGRSPVVRARDQQAAIWTKGCSKPGDQSSPQASSPTDNSGEATATIADAGEQAQHSSRSDGTAEDAGAHDGNIAAVTSAENATGSQEQHSTSLRPSLEDLEKKLEQLQNEARNKKRRRQVLDSSSLRPELVGSEVEVYWPDDATWWSAKLTKVDVAAATIGLQYHSSSEYEEVSGPELETLLGKGHLAVRHGSKSAPRPNRSKHCRSPRPPPAVLTDIIDAPRPARRAKVMSMRNLAMLSRIEKQQDEIELQQLQQQKQQQEEEAAEKLMERSSPSQEPDTLARHNSTNVHWQRRQGQRGAAAVTDLADRIHSSIEWQHEVGSEQRGSDLGMHQGVGGGARSWGGYSETHGSSSNFGLSHGSQMQDSLTHGYDPRYDAELAHARRQQQAQRMQQMQMQQHAAAAAAGWHQGQVRREVLGAQHGSWARQGGMRAWDEGYDQQQHQDSAMAVLAADRQMAMRDAHMRACQHQGALPPARDACRHADGLLSDQLLEPLMPDPLLDHLLTDWGHPSQSMSPPPYPDSGTMQMQRSQRMLQRQQQAHGSRQHPAAAADLLDSSHMRRPSQGDPWEQMLSPPAAEHSMGSDHVPTTASAHHHQTPEAAMRQERKQLYQQLRNQLQARRGLTSPGDASSHMPATQQQQQQQQQQHGAPVTMVPQGHRGPGRSQEMPWGTPASHAAPQQHQQHQQQQRQPRQDQWLDDLPPKADQLGTPRDLAGEVRMSGLGAAGADAAAGMPFGGYSLMDEADGLVDPSAGRHDDLHMDWPFGDRLQEQL